MFIIQLIVGANKSVLLILFIFCCCFYYMYTSGDVKIYLGTMKTLQKKTNYKISYIHNVNNNNKNKTFALQMGIIINIIHFRLKIHFSFNLFKTT